MTTAKDFEEFKQEFRRYQKLFGLSDWKVYFSHGGSDEYFAYLEIDCANQVATAYLNTELTGKDRQHKDVKGNAKHEAIHLLLSRFEGEARARYTSRSSLVEALEATVHRLEDLIP